MLTKSLVAALGLMLLAGCAGDVAQAPLGLDHPANPDAAVADLPAPSDTLKVADAAPQTASNQAAMSRGHEGHVHGGDAAAAPTAAATEQAATGHDHHNHGAPSATTPATQPGAGQVVYVCPMHPEVTSNDPNARCPKCGMKLVKKKEPTKEPATETLPSAPAGRGGEAGQGGHEGHTGHTGHEGHR